MADSAYITQYRQVQPHTTRHYARHAYLSVADAWQRLSGKQSRLLARPRVQLLCLHHVFADEEQSFRALLTNLARDHSFIGYSEAVDRILGDKVDKPYMAVSFDDGLASCVKAADIMYDLGIVGCFFVCGAMVGQEDRSRTDLFSRQRLGMPPMQFMNWDDLEKLRTGGHEIGSHTINHPNMAQIPAQQITDELGESFDLLQKRLGRAEHFAWPYGRFRQFSRQAAHAVFDSGYRSCASAERGCHGPLPVDHRFLCLRRDHLLANWPIGHCRYFLARSARARLTGGSLWPTGWIETIRFGHEDAAPGPR